jgi:SNF2 family DNA or RNA helicase
MKNTKTYSDLRDYQKRGVDFFLNTKSCLLSDEMGLGKTVQVATAIKLLFESAKLKRVLIVVPKALTLQWENELTCWANKIPARIVCGPGPRRRTLFSAPYPILIATYEQIRNEAAFLSQLPDFSLIVFDEAQRIKNQASSVNKACAYLPRKRCWALTGTPIENSQNDMASIFNILIPTLDLSEHAIPSIHREIRECFLRRTKNSVLPSLPPILRQDCLMEMVDEQRLEYDAALRGAERPDQNSEMSSIFALINKLKQICNKTEDARHSVKLGALRDILSNLTGNDDKVIVFSQYVQTLQWLKEETKLPAEIYSGQMDSEQKDGVLSRFRDLPGPRVLFLSLKAAGVGLNIQEASHVVLFDRWWNPALEAQAIARAHRFGRTRHLHVFEFLIKNSIEESIHNIITHKKKLFDAIVDKAPNAQTSALTKEELLTALSSV